MTTLAVVNIVVAILLFTMLVGFRREVYFNGTLLRDGNHDYRWHGIGSTMPHLNFRLKAGSCPDKLTLRWHFGWFCWERHLVVDAELVSRLEADTEEEDLCSST